VNLAYEGSNYKGIKCKVEHGIDYTGLVILSW